MSDLIERARDWRENMDCDPWEVMEQMIDRIAELEAQTQWVSVSERMPEVFEDVLVYNEHTGLYWTAMLLDSGKWWDRRLADVEDVTHWKLITPPGEGL